MRTGSDILHSREQTPHVKAIVTGATAVFTRDLCEDMFKLQAITGSEDMKELAQLCACRLLKRDKCAELEKIVTAVIESDDGMPEIENTALLAEVLQVYAGASNAERAGDGQAYRRDVLVPGIVEDAMEAIAPTEEEGSDFLQSIEQCRHEWDTFVPVTPFQQIVVECIERIGI